MEPPIAAATAPESSGGAGPRRLRLAGAKRAAAAFVNVALNVVAVNVFILV
jgi:hypothetical protein